MKLHELSPAEGSKKAVKRIGRGPASGQGKTAGKGHKGQKARAGRGMRPGFEGGQMPLQRRVPKFGFKNINRVEYVGINLDTLQTLVDNGTITNAIDFNALVENRIVSKNSLVKILGRGELKAKLTVTAHKFTATAKAAIEAAGGEVVSL